MAPKRAQGRAIVEAQSGRKDSRAKFTCRRCGSGQYHEDPATRARYCIPCENLKEERMRAKRQRYEAQHPAPKRDRRVYRAAYYRRTGR